jgi:hypothetical protein
MSLYIGHQYIGKKNDISSIGKTDPDENLADSQLKKNETFWGAKELISKGSIEDGLKMLHTRN